MKIDTMQILLDRCFQLAKLSNCAKRQFGSVIVPTNSLYTEYRDPHKLFAQIKGYGINHIAGWDECSSCLRNGIASGTRMELCRAIHAEQDAILDCFRHHKQLETLKEHSLVVHGRIGNKRLLKEKPAFYCTFCVRLMTEVGIGWVIVPTLRGPAALTITEAWNSAYETAISGQDLVKELSDDYRRPPPGAGAGGEGGNRE